MLAGPKTQVMDDKIYSTLLTSEEEALAQFEIVPERTLKLKDG
jgi:hypothetical protein